jgi:two-component system chemotaxis response regulator CheB
MQHAASVKKPIRVLIVDDSKVGRAAISKTLLEASSQITVVGYAEDGLKALGALDVCDPDIVILDLAMPSMDGITALPLILKKRPNVRVVVCSSLASPGAEMSVKALSLGAADCVPKPIGSKNPNAIAEFKATLTRAVLGLYDAPPPAPPEAIKVKPADLLSFRPRIVAIGSSTGGPNALITLFREMGPLPVPVIVTQHLIDKFTAILARQIQQETGIPCDEARENLMLEPGRIYIAAGGSHMALKRTGNGVLVALDNGPPENFCKPSADPMFRSAVAAYGKDVMAVILTGMGKDGLSGCERVAAAGGRILVQDRESSIVWGMPGSVANAGLANAILPVPGIARSIRACLSKAEAGAK